MHDHVAIAHIEWESRESFHERFVIPGKPAVIRDMFKGAPVNNWTPERLARLLATRPVSVAIAENCVFNYTASRPEFTHRDMSFADASELICGDDSGTRRYYIRQKSIARDFPELAKDLGQPPVLFESELIAINLWFGSKNAVTPLHFDGSNNFFFQAYGKKLVTLFAPDETHLLYQATGSDDFGHTSGVDVMAPDYQAHPLYQNARFIEVLLDAGDCLYLPAFWWHHVQSLSVSISVNYWWSPAPAQYLAPNSLACIPRMFDRDRLSGLGVCGGRIGLLALAEKACEQPRRLWLATLCAAGAFDASVRAVLSGLGASHDSVSSRMTALYTALERVAPPPVAVPAQELELWSRLVAAARKGTDANLSHSDVSRMVRVVRRLVETDDCAAPRE